MIDLLKRNVNKPNPDTAIMEGMNVVSERIEEL